MAVGVGSYVLPRNLPNNQPADFLFTRVGAYWIPTKMALNGMYSLVNSNVDHIRTGLFSTNSPLKSGIMVNNDIGFYINCGKIIVKGHVEEIIGSTVRFDDGSTIGPVDHLLIATGYRPEVPCLEKGILGGTDNP